MEGHALGLRQGPEQESQWEMVVAETWGPAAGSNRQAWGKLEVQPTGLADESDTE